MNVVIKPKSLQGKIPAVASKSDAHRAIICAALSDKPTEIFISEISMDIRATLDCMRAIGAKIDENNGIYKITPVKKPEDSPVVNCSESGSTLRFLLPLVSLLCKNPEFTGCGRLPERPMSPIINLLKSKGIRFFNEKLPMKTTGSFESGEFEIAGDVSSQFISGLLFALPMLAGESKIILTSPLKSAAYVDMTIDTMLRFGVNIIRTDYGFLIPDGQKYISPGKYLVEGDWSNAAFMLTAGALNGKIEVTRLLNGSHQSDKVIVDILKNAGADIKFTDTVSVNKSKIMPFNLDVSECPDLFPICSVLACGAVGESVLYNAERLRIKESDRIKAVFDMITALGGKVKEEADKLIIYGRGKLLGGTVNSVNDHRIAMSAAVASLLCDNEVTIQCAEAVNKSYPTFYEDFKLLGGDINVF